MAGKRRLEVWLGFALVGCAAPKPAPVAPTPTTDPPHAAAEIAAETPDLSPVATPAGVFAVGRLARPLAFSDTILGWAGLPIGLREILPGRTRDLDRAIAWDAPLEFALVLSPSNPKNPVEAFVSFGLTSVDAAKQVAGERGYEVERVAPGVYAVGGLKGTACAIAPALGSATARLVCASRRSELEDVIPYATRGLPNEGFGAHDLDFELRVEPIRQKFGSSISRARLFAGFLVPRLALDVPRFDSALSDATYALADEAVALVDDLETLRVEGTAIRERQALELDIALRFRKNKSFTAGLIQESAAHRGPAPAAFFRMPAAATSGGFSYAVEPKRWDGVRRVVGELLDAYLEHERVKGSLRDRSRALTDLLFQLGYPVTAFADGVSEASAPGQAASGWSIFRSETPASKLRPALADLHALLGDRGLRTAVSRRFHADEKALPTARLGRLTGPGIPAATQLLTVTLPADFRKQLGDQVGMAAPRGTATSQDYAIAVVADGTGSLIGVAPTPKELAARLGPVLTGKGRALSDRSELATFREINAAAARFTSVEALAGELDASPEEVRRSLSSLPHHGRLPITMRFDAEVSPSPVGRMHVTVPAGVFEDLPGLAPMVLEKFGSRLLK